MLLGYCADLLMCDSFEEVDIVCTTDYQKLLKFKNPRNWVTWKSNESNRTKNRRKGVFKCLRSKYDLNNQQAEIINLVSEKIIELILS